MQLTGQEHITIFFYFFPGVGGAHHGHLGHPGHGHPGAHHPAHPLPTLMHMGYGAAAATAGTHRGPHSMLGQDTGAPCMTSYFQHRSAW